MKSRTTSDFRRCLGALPPEIRARARQAYKLFATNPSHPSLHFKRVDRSEPIYSVRVTLDYRALCVIQKQRLVGIILPGIPMPGDIAVWFWIGTHSDYDKII